MEKQLHVKGHTWETSRNTLVAGNRFKDIGEGPAYWRHKQAFIKTLLVLAVGKTWEKRVSKLRSPNQGDKN